MAQFPTPVSGAALPPLCAMPAMPPRLDSTAANLIEEHCLFGLPQRSASWRHGCTQYVFRPGYVAEYSDFDRIPLWVGECVTKLRSETLFGLGFAKRANLSFAAEELLRPGTSANPQDYDHADYDPGHHAASADFAADKVLMCESFRLSNNAPQAVDLNRRLWRTLERRIRARVKITDDPIFIITGGFFWQDPQFSATSAIPGQIAYLRIGTGPELSGNGGGLDPKKSVSVPTHFFKTVVWRESNTAPWRATTVVFENGGCANDRGPLASCALADHVVALRWVEARTGLVLLPDASPEQRRVLEAGEIPEWLLK